VDAGRAAVLLPGQRYSTDRPLLQYAGLAAERRGASLQRISWTVPGFGDDDGGERDWVAAQVAAAVGAVTAATGVTTPVVAGKSLGSLAAGVTAGCPPCG
jgi:pimeloyl-ACP methyl ester carboxylesterase